MREEINLYDKEGAEFRTVKFELNTKHPNYIVLDNFRAELYLCKYMSLIESLHELVVAHQKLNKRNAAAIYIVQDETFKKSKYKLAFRVKSD